MYSIIYNSLITVVSMMFCHYQGVSPNKTVSFVDVEQCSHGVTDLIECRTTNNSPTSVCNVKYGDVMHNIKSSVLVNLNDVFFVAETVIPIVSMCPRNVVSKHCTTGTKRHIESHDDHLTKKKNVTYAKTVVVHTYDVELPDESDTVPNCDTIRVDDMCLSHCDIDYGNDYGQFM